MTPNTAEDRIRYAKQFYTLLVNFSAAERLLQLSPNKRIHAMKALSSLARFTGCQGTWRQIRQQYGLQWSTGTEKLDAFTRFFDDTKDLDTMLQWLKEAKFAMAKQNWNFYLFCTLTGLRASECVEAVRLLHLPQNSGLNNYYNPEQKILQHYRFPELFIRRTKTVYISVVDDSIVSIARKIGKAPTLNALKMQSRRTCLSMKLKYCRKIYASWLHKSGISSDLIDMLQGRIGKNIFLKHYLTPSADYKEDVLQALEQLQRQL
jgi:intergrase/recombinase